MKFHFMMACGCWLALASSCMVTGSKRSKEGLSHRQPIAAEGCVDVTGRRFQDKQKWRQRYHVNKNSNSTCQEEDLACQCLSAQISCRDAQQQDVMFCTVDPGGPGPQGPQPSVATAFDSDKLCQPGAQAWERLKHDLVCRSLGQNYSGTPISTTEQKQPASLHADLNIFVRGFDCMNKQADAAGLDPRLARTEDLKQFSFFTAWDALAPRLQTMFKPVRPGDFANSYSTNNWNWSLNNNLGGRSGGLQGSLDVLGLKTQKDEQIHVPSSGYDIGGGFEVVVLYASPSTITLKYTREDNIVSGYGLHFTGICVDPALVASFESLKSTGQRPGLRARQAFGYALGNEVQVSVRDTGSFMNATSRHDWFQEDKFDQ